MKTKNTYTVLLISLILLSFSFGPCDESLPSYQEPAKIFIADLSFLYALEYDDNTLKIYIAVTNIFDETLQGSASFQGTIEIVSARDPQVKKTFQLHAANVIQAKGYDRRSGILTLDPQDTIRLGVSWDFIDDSGRDLRQDFFQYYDDPTCMNLRRLAYTEDFVATGKMTVFTRTGSVQVNTGQYTLCYVTKNIKQICPAPPQCKRFPQ